MHAKFFDTEAEAQDWMRAKNRSKDEIYCVVAGPENNFAVVDLATVIDMNIIPYEWAV